MDINELIDNLRFPSWHDLEDPDATLLADAADALSTLQAEEGGLTWNVQRISTKIDGISTEQKCEWYSILEPEKSG